MLYILHYIYLLDFPFSVLFIFLFIFNNYIVNPVTYSPYYFIPITPIRPRLYTALTVDLIASL